MFQINEVVEFENELYRILAILLEEVVWIPVTKAGIFPSLIPLETLVNAVENGMLVRKPDPFANLIYEMPAKGSVQQQKLEKNLQLIQPIICDADCFLPKVRSARIAQVIAEHSTTKQTLYRLLMRYWQRGQTANALLPDYKNSGGRGKTRQARDKKLGRPRVHTPGKGAIVDEATRRLFRIAIEKHLLTDKENGLKSAHNHFKGMYETFYPQVAEAEMPTIWQFGHFYRREYDKPEILERQTTRIEYRKDIRPLTSTVNANLLGPGSCFEIDATLADIYLVSDNDRRNIIGRPVVYVVVDVFSRMVAGLYVGLENPSYATAMLALLNALTDKVAYCKEYGFEIDYEDWPIVGIPDAIMADRGELFGHQIEALECAFSVRIENAPPHRGDCKGVVERGFGTVQAKFKPHAPGVVVGPLAKKRGGKDYRLDAQLTVKEFTGIILAAVLYRNRFHTLEKYDREPDMPTDLPMTPISLWNWGIHNRTGKLRTAPYDAVKVALLPRAKATLSELGVCIFGIYFTCQEIVKKGWLHRSKEVKRPQNMQAAYDPWSADSIYLFPNANSTEYWLCTLTPHCREFIGCSFWDVWQITDEQKKAVAENKLVSDAKHRELDRYIQEKIKNAKQAMPSDIREISKTQRIKGIRQNRKQEKQDERIRRQKSNKDGEITKDSSNLTNVVPLRATDNDDDLAFPSFIDELFDE